MTQALDPTRPPREGEELDLDRLEPHLRERLAERLELPPEDVRLELEQFPSGYSNLTYLLRWGELELVLRRPPFGNRVESAHDMGREYRVLSALHPIYPAAPEPYIFTDGPEVLGAPFYLMERRRGVILRREMPPGVELTPVLARKLSQSVIAHLAELHQLDYEAAGLGDLDKGEGYVERQVRGWAKRYERAQTDSWPELDLVAAWLHEERPRDSPFALIHNDYKYDNLVLDPENLTRIVGVLDWEMATVGDPLMDLGASLAYWTEAGDPPQWRSASFGPTAVAGSLTRRELIDEYQRSTGRRVEHPVFYFAFGLFRLAVIGQQIYYRFFKGHTRDERFSKLNQMVGLLGRVAARAIETGRV